MCIDDWNKGHRRWSKINFNCIYRSEAKVGTVTRSQKTEQSKPGQVAEMTYYTTLNGDAKNSKSNNKIQVISKKKLAQDPAHYEELVRGGS